mmetsp:Transcript_15485/g.28117  ORF Transcript_15485/g.28117 Transcript_15485/m.28117 type:complete len:308 (+) Transcript_15485:511-1434(+)
MDFVLFALGLVQLVRKLLELLLRHASTVCLHLVLCRLLLRQLLLQILRIRIHPSILPQYQYLLLEQVNVHILFTQAAGKALFRFSLRIVEGGHLVHELHLHATLVLHNVGDLLLHAADNLVAGALDHGHLVVEHPHGLHGLAELRLQVEHVARVRSDRGGYALLIREHIDLAHVPVQLGHSVVRRLLVSPEVLHLQPQPVELFLVLGLQRSNLGAQHGNGLVLPLLLLLLRRNLRVTRQQRVRVIRVVRLVFVVVTVRLLRPLRRLRFPTRLLFLHRHARQLIQDFGVRHFEFMCRLHVTLVTNELA